jgi:hypothetical protein
MANFDLLPIVLTSSLIGAIVGALINQLLGRRAAKKNPKTEERAKAYDAIVVHIFNSIESDTIVRDFQRDRELVSLLARLSLFGESGVVKVTSIFASEFLSSAAGIGSTAILPVIRAMRESLLTGRTAGTMEAIETIVRSLPISNSVNYMEHATPSQSVPSKSSDA